MLREIVIPHSENYNVKIPPEYIDREVEILVLPMDTSKSKDNMSNDLLKNKKKLTAISIDTKNFKFNRNEANER